MATITFTDLGLTGKGAVYQTGPESFYKPNAFITVSSANNITLTNPLASVIRAEFSTSGKHLIMPAMNATNSRQAGETIFIVNDAANSFDLYANDNTTLIYPNIQTNQWIILNITDNLDANGGFFPLPIGTLGFQNSSNVSIEDLIVSGGSVLTSVFLPTSGGTAASLNYYEEDVVVSISFTGAWSQSFNFTFTRIGKSVICRFPDLLDTATVANNLTAASASIPARLRPAVALRKWCSSRDNGATLANPSEMYFDPNGMITINKTAASGSTSFTNGASCGLFSNQVSWMVA